MDSINNSARTVIVVDRRPLDYAKLALGASRWNLRLRFFRSADEAIRSPRTFLGGLWLINLDLLDMSAVDLLVFVRESNPGVAVFLVGDSYDQDDEILARAAGPTAYVCKPPDAVWLSGWRPGVRATPTGSSAHRGYTQPAAYY